MSSRLQNGREGSRERRNVVRPRRIILGSARYSQDEESASAKTWHGVFAVRRNFVERRRSGRFAADLFSVQAVLEDCEGREAGRWGVTFRPRHYHCGLGDEKPSRYQIDAELEPHSVRSRGGPCIPDSIQRLAHAEYARQHPGQDYEIMQERGGLSVLEIVRLLADYVERLGGKPTEPREAARPGGGV